MSITNFSLLKERFDFIVERDSSDHLAVNCPVEHFATFFSALRDDFGYDLLSCVTAVDWDVQSPRFTGIYHLLSTATHQYIRIAVDCLDDINTSLPTLSNLFPAADWHERETYDLYGIRYTNHPNMRRILMWDDYPYYPLRKDYPLAGIEVPFPAADVADSANAKVLPAPMMGGPFVSSADGSFRDCEPVAKDESWTEKEEAP